MQRRDLCELTNVCDPDRKRDESLLRRRLDFLAKAARWGLSEERRSALPCALEATNKKRKRRDAKKGDVPKKR